MTGEFFAFKANPGLQLAQGQRVRPRQIRARQESGLTESGLIRALREQGIGRPMR